MRRPTQKSSFAANNELAEIHATDPSEYGKFSADRLPFRNPTTFPASSYVTHSGCAGAAYAPGIFLDGDYNLYFTRAAKLVVLHDDQKLRTAQRRRSSQYEPSPSRDVQTSANESSATRENVQPNRANGEALLTADLGSCSSRNRIIL